MLKLRESLKEGGGLTPAYDVGNFREGMVLLAGGDLNLEAFDVFGLDPGDELDRSLRGLVQEALAALADDGADVVFLVRPPWIKAPRRRGGLLCCLPSCCRRRKWRRRRRLIDRIRWLCVAAESLMVRLLFARRRSDKLHDVFLSGGISEKDVLNWSKTFCENRGISVFLELPCDGAKALKAAAQAAVAGDEPVVLQKSGTKQLKNKSLSRLPSQGVLLRAQSLKAAADATDGETTAEEGLNMSSAASHGAPFVSEAAGAFSSQFESEGAKEATSTRGRRGRGKGHRSKSAGGNRLGIKHGPPPCVEWLQQRREAVRQSRVLVVVVGGSEEWDNLTVVLDCLWAWQFGIPILPVRRHGQEVSLRKLRRAYPWAFRLRLGVPEAGMGASRQYLSVILQRALVKAARSRARRSRREQLPKNFEPLLALCCSRFKAMVDELGLSDRKTAAQAAKAAGEKPQEEAFGNGRQTAARGSMARQSVARQSVARHTTARHSVASMASVAPVGARGSVAEGRNRRRSSIGSVITVAVTKTPAEEAEEAGELPPPLAERAYGVVALLALYSERLHRTCILGANALRCVARSEPGASSIFEFGGVEALLWAMSCSASQMLAAGAEADSSARGPDSGRRRLLGFLPWSPRSGGASARSPAPTPRSGRAGLLSRFWRGGDESPPLSPGSRSPGASPRGLRSPRARSARSSTSGRASVSARASVSEAGTAMDGAATARSGASSRAELLARVADAGVRLAPSEEGYCMVENCVAALRNLACKKPERKAVLVLCGAARSACRCAELRHAEGEHLRVAAAGLLRNLSAGAEPATVLGLVRAGCLATVERQLQHDGSSGEVRRHLLAAIQNIMGSDALPPRAGSAAAPAERGPPAFDPAWCDRWITICNAAMQRAVAAEERRVASQALMAMANLALVRAGEAALMDSLGQSEEPAFRSSVSQGWGSQAEKAAASQQHAEEDGASSGWSNSEDDDEESSGSAWETELSSAPWGSSQAEVMAGPNLLASEESGWGDAAAQPAMGAAVSAGAWGDSSGGESGERPEAESDGDGGWGSQAQGGRRRREGPRGEAALQSEGAWTGGGRSSLGEDAWTGSSRFGPGWGGSKGSAGASSGSEGEGGGDARLADDDHDSLPTEAADLEKSIKIAERRVQKAVLKDMLGLLTGKRPKAVVTSAITALCNFAQDVHVERLIGRLGGIELVLEQLSSSRNKAQSLQSLRFLWNMSFSRTNQEQLLEGGALAQVMMVLNMFRAPDDAALHEQGCGFLRNLSTGPARQKRSLFSRGIVRILCKSIAQYPRERGVCMQASAALRLLGHCAPPVADEAAQFGGVEAALGSLELVGEDWAWADQLLHALECMLLSPSGLKLFVNARGHHAMLALVKRTEAPSSTKIRVCRVLSTALSHGASGAEEELAAGSPSEGSPSASPSASPRSPSVWGRSGADPGSPGESGTASPGSPMSPGAGGRSPTAILARSTMQVGRTTTLGSAVGRTTTLGSAVGRTTTAGTMGSEKSGKKSRKTRKTVMAVKIPAVLLREDLIEERCTKFLCEMMEACAADADVCEAVATTLVNYTVCIGKQYGAITGLKGEVGRLTAFFMTLTERWIYDNDRRATASKFVQGIFQLYTSLCFDEFAIIHLHRERTGERTLKWMELYEDDPHVQIEGCILLRNFSALLFRAREGVVDAGGIPQLAALLKRRAGEKRVVRAALSALHNLATAWEAIQQIKDTGLAPQVIGLLAAHGASESVQEHAFAVLWNFAAEPVLAEDLVGLDAVSQVARAVGKFPKSPHVLVPALGLLRNLFVGATFARDAAAQLYEAKGYEFLFDLLWQHCLPDARLRARKRKEYAADVAVPPEAYATEMSTKMTEQILAVLSNITFIPKDMRYHYEELIILEFEQNPAVSKKLRQVLEIHAASAMAQYQGFTLVLQVVSAKYSLKAPFSGFGAFVGRMMKLHKGTPVLDAAALLLDEVA